MKAKQETRTQTALRGTKPGQRGDPNDPEKGEGEGVGEGEDDAQERRSWKGLTESLEHHLDLTLREIQGGGEGCGKGQEKGF